VAEYDYAIVNEDLIVAVAQVAAILEGEAWRVSRQDTLPTFIEQLQKDVVKSAEKIGKQSPVASQQSPEKRAKRRS
jgi:guanylate kinase